MKNTIRTVMIAVFLGTSLMTVSGARVATAQESPCGYGTRHCSEVEHCLTPDFSLLSLPFWVIGLLVDLCETTYTYYP